MKEVIKIADNIVSPLGLSTEETFQALKSGKSALKSYPATPALPEPYFASLLGDLEPEYLRCGIPDGYTSFERRLILSVKLALEQTTVDPSSEDLLFIISSTKGNVELLDSEALPGNAGQSGTVALSGNDGLSDEALTGNDKPGGETADARLLIGESARKVAEFFGNHNTPIVVSNACISGLCALIEASRTLRSGAYGTVIVTGTDVQSRFIISGFQSFKALSSRACRPFDKDRKGLNLGEAVATAVLTYAEPGENDWVLSKGAVRNDANHISGPSRTGEGSYRALRAVLHDAEDLAFVNVHGTATAYNDEMESIAISRAGLSDVPVTALKGYFGHTMGAAGILESILSMRAADEGCVIGVRGYEECGVSKPLNISPENRTTDKRSFIKLLSGFGGCNAALLFTKGGHDHEKSPRDPEREGLSADAAVLDRTKARHNAFKTVHSVRITPDRVLVDGKILKFESSGKATAHSLTDIYREKIGDWPKFFKMDGLCQLGFVASELLLSQEERKKKDCEDRAVILFSRGGCLANDRRYQETIKSPTEYFPSPGVFVYTLSNIVTGEIAIRNKYYGETSCYLLPSREDALSGDAFAPTARRLLEDTFSDPVTESALGGWLDYENETAYDAQLYIIERNSDMNEELVLELKNKVIEALKLADMQPSDIDEDAPLFGEGLGLDSIDALELMLLMEKNYGIRLSNPAEGKEIFKSVRVMADYIAANRKK